MRSKGSVDVIDGTANDVYSAAGTRQNLYGLFNFNTQEWHGGGRVWNPMRGLMPSVLHKTVEEAGLELAILGAPEYVRILHVLATFMPISVIQEENDGTLRQEDGSGPDGVEQSME